MAHDFEQTRWTLVELVPTSEGVPDADALESMISELNEHTARFEAARETLSSEMASEELLAVIQLSETIYDILTRLFAFAYMWMSEDTQAQEALSFMGRINQLSTDIRNRMLFFSLWWKGLDDEPAQRLMANSGEYEYYLESMRHFRPYTLSEPEEKIINLKDVNGTDALSNLYEVITNRFAFTLEVDGEAKEMTRDELSVHVRSPQAGVRAAAYQELYRVFSDQATVLGQIYGHLVRDWSSENIDLRGFASPISVRNLSNDIPDAVTDTLLDVCRTNMPLFHRYFAWKARQLGMERLHRYDIYAPVSAAEKTYLFSEAVDLAVTSLEQFSPLLAKHALQVLVDGHLDSEVRPGKRGGAYCYSVAPELTPWVLVNYVGQIDDVQTLAHELGHAVHGSMAADHSVLTFRSTLPMAETASVFSQMLLTDRMLREETDQAVRRDLLSLTLDYAYATIARQVYIVLFEVDAHRLAVEAATTDDLCELYLDNLRDQFGDSVELSDEFRWEWTAIPHIYDRPFYCYAYAFGNLLVLALYRQFKEEGAAFVPRYERILSYGGSASPAHIIGEAGFDMASAGFWQGGFDVLTGFLDELEAMGPDEAGD